MFFFLNFPLFYSTFYVVLVEPLPNIRRKNFFLAVRNKKGAELFIRILA
jgi:hypothetical protein